MFKKKSTAAKMKTLPPIITSSFKFSSHKEIHIQTMQPMRPKLPSTSARLVLTSVLSLIVIVDKHFQLQVKLRNILCPWYAIVIT